MRKHICAVGFLAILSFFPVGMAHAVTVATPAHQATASSSVSTVPIESHVGQGIMIFSLAIFLIAANAGGIALAIALNFRKSLSYDDADGWENPQYVRALSNALAVLSERQFKSPWPRRCNPWSMHHFERRLLRAIRPRLRHRSSAFVERHISLWIWVESHRGECRCWLRAKQVERALECLSTANAPDERAELLAFLNTSQKHGIRLPEDPQTRHRLQNLQRIQLIMREHGFNLSREFAQADLLEQAPKEEIAEVLLSL